MMRSRCKSGLAYDRSMEVIKVLRVQLDSIPSDIGQIVAEIDAPDGGDDPTINPSAPLLSQTKGRKHDNDELETTIAL